MVVHFLQSRNPPILPCLQRIGSQREPHWIEGYDVSFFDSLEELSQHGFDSSSNIEHMGRLLIAFFRYYAIEYDFHTSVVSVRTGGLLLRSEKGWSIEDEGCHRYTICIEDPFDESHNLGRVVSRTGFREIRGEFTRAYRMLLERRSITDLCQPILPA
jgi:DNA polymerase sigma